MKLTAAKCPSCGASIKVDRNEESTTCEYCHNDIIIEDAVEKYKIELSGKVKVSGIKDNDDRLKDAKNYLKLNEFNETVTTLNTIIRDEPFNIEAYTLLVKANVLQFQQLYDFDNFDTDPEFNPVFWEDVDYLLSNYERLITIDEKKKYEKKLAEEMSVLDKIVDAQEKRLDDIEECLKIDELLDEITSYKFKPNISKAVKRDFKHINPLIVRFFKDTLGCSMLSLPGKHRSMHRDMTIYYLDNNSNFQTGEITKYHSLKEVEEALENNKKTLFEQIDGRAKNIKPVRVIKNLLGK